LAEEETGQRESEQKLTSREHARPNVTSNKRKVISTCCEGKSKGDATLLLVTASLAVIPSFVYKVSKNFLLFTTGWPL